MSLMQIKQQTLLMAIAPTKLSILNSTINGLYGSSNCSSFFTVCAWQNPQATWNDPIAVSNTSKIFDVLALTGDVFGEGLAVGGLIVSGPEGYEAGNALAQITSNRVSNFLSATSTLLTARADELTGNRETTIVIRNIPIPVPVGKNTINSYVTTMVGFVPDTTVDVIASAVQVFANDNPDSYSFPLH